MTKNAPELRFNGFTDDWELRKLKELAHFSKGNGYTKDDLIDFGSPIILYGRLYTKYQTIIDSVDTFVNKKDRSVISKGDEVIVPASGETSKDISRASVIGKPGLIIGGDLNIINPKKSIDSIFLALTISNGTQQKEMTKRAQGKSVVHLRNSDLKEVNLFYPELEEQKKISIFFNQLDNTIALHQRKLDLLKQLKQTYLQKMFPRNGEGVPEIRFANFDEEWEQRKFYEVLDYSISNNTLSRAKLNNDNGEVKNIHYGDILTKFNSVVNIAEDSIPYITNGSPEEYRRNLLENGDIVLADTAEDETAGKAIEIAGIADNYAVSGLHTMVARPNIKFASNYLGYYLNSPSYHKQLIKLMQGIKVLSISKTNVAKTDIKYPIKTNEQQQLGLFFKQIDNAISLYQEKNKALKTIKKAFLSKLFI